MTFDFENRTLVVTGGIGGAIAELYYASGANLVLTDLDETALLGGVVTVTGTGRIEATMAVL